MCTFDLVVLAVEWGSGRRKGKLSSVHLGARHAQSDGVLESPRYPGGVALRFARVRRYRDDKPADQADTLQALQALLE